MEFGGRCKKGKEAVCRDWVRKNSKEVICEGVSRLSQGAYSVH